MTDTTVAETPKLKAPKKPRRKRAVAAKPAPGSPFADITPRDCPTACKPDRCAISGCAICAHPHKGGLQATLQTPEAMRRLNEAKRVLGKAKLDLVTS
jgi:hypothetical protein